MSDAMKKDAELAVKQAQAEASAAAGQATAAAVADEAKAEGFLRRNVWVLVGIAVAAAGVAAVVLW